MSLPDYAKTEFGTAIVWGEASGVGVTKTLSLNGLPTGTGRMGESVDLGASWDDECLLQLYVETGTGPEANTVVELFLAWSLDNTIWPGKVTGSDASYTISNKFQLGPPIISLIGTFDANTILAQNPIIIRARSRYVASVVINLFNVDLRDEAVTSDNNSRVILIPRRYFMQDTA